MTRLRWALPVLAAALALVVTGGASSPRASAAPEIGWVWPLDPTPRVVRGFEPPESPYGPGHRGVDLGGTVGQQVMAIGAGTVAFAGSVAGRSVVVVDHGVLSSTYQPVTAYVSVGQPVAAGEPIGSLQLIGSHCAPDACLHLGVKRGAVYLDPLGLLPARSVRLKPIGGLTAGSTPGTRWVRHRGAEPPRSRSTSTISSIAEGAVAGLAAAIRPDAWPRPPPG